MRTLDPGPGTPNQWTKECRCTGAGNGNQGCQALLLVEWSDLFLTMFGGDPRDVIQNPQAPRTAEELLHWANDAFARNVTPFSLADPTIFVTFRCHMCQAETDLLEMTVAEISRGFYLLSTMREWDMKRAQFRKE